MIALMIFLVIVLLSDIIRHLSLGKIRFICSNQNCGYSGYAISKEKGSLFMFLFLIFVGVIPYVYSIREEKESLILMVIGVIPGSIYYIFKGENYNICPKCRIKISKDLD